MVVVTVNDDCEDGDDGLNKRSDDSGISFKSDIRGKKVHKCIKIDFLGSRPGRGRSPVE